LEGGFVDHLFDVCSDGLGAGEDVESEVAAAFGPFVVLFGQDGADEPDEPSRVLCRSYVGCGSVLAAA
jgi:hypothetical protein